MRLKKTAVQNWDGCRQLILFCGPYSIAPGATTVDVHISFHLATAFHLQWSIMNCKQRELRLLLQTNENDQHSLCIYRSAAPWLVKGWKVACNFFATGDIIAQSFKFAPKFCKNGEFYSMKFCILLTKIFRRKKIFQQDKIWELGQLPTSHFLPCRPWRYWCRCNLFTMSLICFRLFRVQPWYSASGGCVDQVW